MSQIPISTVPPGQVETVQSRLYRLRVAMLQVITPEKIAAVMEAMQQKAAEGNTGAAKLVLGYIVGLPGKSIDQNIGQPEQPVDMVQTIVQAVVDGKAGLDPHSEGLLRQWCTEKLSPQTVTKPQAPHRSNGLNGDARAERKKSSA